MLLTLIFANFSPIPLRNTDAGKVSTQYDDLRNEAVLHAVVEYLAQPEKGIWPVKPDIGQDKKAKVRKL